MRTMCQHPGPGSGLREKGSEQGLCPTSLLGKEPDVSVIGWAYGEGILGHGPAA